MTHTQRWARWIGLAAAGLILALGLVLVTVRVRAQTAPAGQEGLPPAAEGCCVPRGGPASCPMFGPATGGCVPGLGAPPPGRTDSGDPAESLPSCH